MNLIKALNKITELYVFMFKLIGFFLWCVLVTELFLRAISISQDIQAVGAYKVVDKYVGIKLKPHILVHVEDLSPYKEFAYTVETNSYGYRAPDYDLRKPADTFRILILGDSEVWGWGVKSRQMFSSVLEERLKAALGEGKRVEVINASLQAYGTINNYLLLKHEGLLFNPDLVINCFSANDLYNNIVEWDEFILDSNGLPALYKHREQAGPLSKILPQEIRSWFQINFKSYNLFHSYFSQLRLLFADPQNIDYYNNEQVDQFVLINDEHWYENKLYQEGWDNTKRLFIEMKKLCDQNQADLLMITIPFPTQVDTSEWSLGRGEFNFRKDIVYGETYQKALASSANELDFEAYNFLDLFREYKMANPDSSLFFDFDGHLSICGNSLMGNTIADLIAKRNAKFITFGLKDPEQMETANSAWR